MGNVFNSSTSSNEKILFVEDNNAFKQTKHKNKMVTKRVGFFHNPLRIFYRVETNKVLCISIFNIGERR